MPNRKTKKKDNSNRKDSSGPTRKSRVGVVRAVPKRVKRKVRRQRKIGFDLGRAGANLGSKVGSFVGRAANNWFGSILGSGAYRVNSNSLMTGNGPPIFAGKTGTRLRHREFIADISGSTTFNLSSYFLNPGLDATFPWLSNIAYNFEQYRFHGLIFEFRTTSATAVSSTNTALGTVIMATDYDDLDAVFSNKQQMEAYEFSVSTVPCANAIHPIECSPRETPLPKLWVRTGSYSSYSTVDPRLYDMGRFQVATTGMQAAATIGELWVSYDVEFFKPKLASYNSNTLSWHAYGQNTSGSVVLYNPTVSSTSSLGITLYGSAPGYTGITVPNLGRYYATAVAKAGTSISNWGDWAALTNVSLVQVWSTSSGNNLSTTNSSGAGTNSVAAHVIFDVTASNGVLLFSNSLTIVGNCYYDVFVTEVASNFTLSSHEELPIADKVRALEKRLEKYDLQEHYEFFDYKEPSSPTPSQSSSKSLTKRRM